MVLVVHEDRMISWIEIEYQRLIWTDYERQLRVSKCFVRGSSFSPDPGSLRPIDRHRLTEKNDRGADLWWCGGVAIVRAEIGGGGTPCLASDAALTIHNQALEEQQKKIHRFLKRKK